MGLWFFLSEWFSDIPTHGALFKRSMINAAWAMGLILVLMFLKAPADCAFLVVVATFAANGVMFVIFQKQRD